MADKYDEAGVKAAFNKVKSDVKNIRIMGLCLGVALILVAVVAVV